MNSADQLIYSASLLADAGDGEGALSALEDAISLSEAAGYPLQLLRARLLLGELLLRAGLREDAAAEFRGVLQVAEDFAGDLDVVDQEVAAATEYLAVLSGDDAS